jgi:putative acetyltransferase
VIATHRPALPADAARLFELRRKSIIALAPDGMSVAAAETWAASLTRDGMTDKLRALEIWVAEIDGRAAGWGAIRHDRLEGLYVDPEFAGRGIGTALLGTLETLLRGRGVAGIRADASANAEEFYLRRGYAPAGGRGETLPVVKRLA